MEEKLAYRSFDTHKTKKNFIFSWKIINKKLYENSDYVKLPGISEFEQEGDMQMTTALVSGQLDYLNSRGSVDYRIKVIVAY